MLSTKSPLMIVVSIIMMAVSRAEGSDDCVWQNDKCMSKDQFISNYTECTKLTTGDECEADTTCHWDTSYVSDYYVVDGNPFCRLGKASSEYFRCRAWGTKENCESNPDAPTFSDEFKKLGDDYGGKISEKMEANPFSDWIELLVNPRPLLKTFQKSIATDLDVDSLSMESILANLGPEQLKVAQDQINTLMGGREIADKYLGLANKVLGISQDVIDCAPAAYLLIDNSIRRAENYFSQNIQLKKSPTSPRDLEGGAVEYPSCFYLAYYGLSMFFDDPQLTLIQRNGILDCLAEIQDLQPKCKPVIGAVLGMYTPTSRVLEMFEEVPFFSSIIDKLSVPKMRAVMTEGVSFIEMYEAGNQVLGDSATRQQFRSDIGNSGALAQPWCSLLLVLATFLSFSA